MRLFTVILTLFSFSVFAQGPYAPAVDSLGTTAMHKDSSVFVDWASASIIERGWQNITDTTLGKTTTGDNFSATDKSGINGVVSLGDNGSAILTFSSPIINGSGFDFAVFENGFNNTFLELAHVEVSSDGINFFRFESVSLSQINSQITNIVDATEVYNLAGKYRAQYGTPFDLEEFVGTTGLDVNNITHVKIIDVIGSISESFATFDSQGNKINDPFPTPFETGGFDLDAVGVIHSFVGISESISTFKMYPNPANSTVHLLFNKTALQQIEIINLNGVIVEQFNTSSSNFQVDVSNYSKGFYFIRTTVEGDSSIQKLLID